MQQYTVTGMHCAACSASVEKAVKKVPGVTSCAVSLLTNSMGVEGTAETAAVIKAVEDAGYGASVRGQEATPAADASALEDRQTPHLKKRLIASVAFLLILMYFSMGHMMWGWPLPSWFDGNHVAMGLVQLLLAGIVMVINQEFFVSGTKSLLRGSPNMDTLVSLGAAASYGWSVYALFAMTDAQLHGGSEAAMAYMDEFYFESAAMILTLITVGKLLEAHSKGKTTDALKSLMALAPETATVIRDGKEVKIPAAQVRKGDVFVVRPGQSIPVDGIVLVATMITDEHRRAIDSCRVPIVLIGQHVEGAACVYHDDYEAAFELGHALAGRVDGKIAYIGVTEEDRAAGYDRRRGFEAGLRAAGNPLDAALIRLGSFTLDSGYGAARELLSAAPDVSFIACATDTMAAGALRAIDEVRGVGEGMHRVSGFGDNAFLRALTGGIPTVHYGYLTSGVEATNMLINTLDGVEGESGLKTLKLGHQLMNV